MLATDAGDPGTATSRQRVTNDFKAALNSVEPSAIVRLVIKNGLTQKFEAAGPSRDDATELASKLLTDGQTRQFLRQCAMLATTIFTSCDPCWPRPGRASHRPGASRDRWLAAPALSGTRKSLFLSAAFRRPRCSGQFPNIAGTAARRATTGGHLGYRHIVAVAWLTRLQVAQLAPASRPRCLLGSRVERVAGNRRVDQCVQTRIAAPGHAIIAGRAAARAVQPFDAPLIVIAAREA